MAAEKFASRVFAVLLLWFAHGRAAVANPQLQRESYVLEEIVVQDEAAAVDVPRSVLPAQEITRDTLETTSVVDPEDALEFLPDLYIRRNEPFRLGASTVRLQGADPNKTAVLINGKRMLGGVDGVVDLRDIPAVLLDRLELHRGVAGGFVDSEAMAGSINIVTRTPKAQPEWTATAAGGSFDRIFAGASHSYRWRGLAYLVAYEHDELALARQFGAISRQFEGSGSDAKQTRDNVFLHAAFDATDRHQISSTIHFLPVREGPLSRRLNATTDVGWRGRFPGPTEVHLAAGRFGFDRRNDLAGFEEDVAFEQWFGEARAALPPWIVWDSHHSIEAAYRFRLPSLRLAAGGLGEAATSLASPPRVAENTSLQSWALRYDWSDLGPWSANAGTNFDLHSLFGLEVNPRAVVTFRPTDRFRLSVGVGRGFRAPDLLQLFDLDLNNVVAVGNRPTGYAILGDRTLRPEIDLATNVDLTWWPASWLRVQSNLFRHDFRDLIDVVLRCTGPQQCAAGFTHPFPTLVGQVFQYANVSEAETAGADLSLEISWSAFGRNGRPPLTGSVGLNYGYLYSRNDSERPGEKGKDLPFRPPHRFIPSLFVRDEVSGASGRFWAEYDDRVFTDLVNSAAGIVRAHWILNARFEWSPSPWFEVGHANGWKSLLANGSVFLEGSNLLDTEFGVPGPLTRMAGRRSLFFGIRTQR